MQQQDESKVAAPVGGVDVLAVLNRHLVLAEQCASPEQVAEAHTVFNAVAELIAERDLLLRHMREIHAICTEPQGAFRKRGGTRWGLAGIEATAALIPFQTGGAE